MGHELYQVPFILSARAAFEAADRAGVYLQIECDMWNVFAPDAQNEQRIVGRDKAYT